MAFSIVLSENTPATSGRDVITLKAENLIVSPERSPIVIPMPGGSVVGLDLGRIKKRITITGVVDTEVKEIFVDGNVGAFTLGETITGNASLNSSTTPSRAATPSAKIIGAYPSLSAPTSLFVSTWGPTAIADRFFVNNEKLTGASSSAYAYVNQAFPSKLRLEQMAESWYANGVMTLATGDKSYSVQLNGAAFSMESGREDRYEMKLDFVQMS